MSVNNLFSNNGVLWSIRANDISGNYGQKIDLSTVNAVHFLTGGTSRAMFNNSGLVLQSGGNTITTQQSSNLILDASNSFISLRTSGVERARITDANFTIYNNLNMNSNRINNCQDPSSAQDVATKNYVDVSRNVLSSWTTAGRPNPATSYLLGYNTTDARIDFYNGASWKQLQFVVPYITATGGIETTYTLGGTTYKVHSFLTTGASNFNISSLSTLNNSIDYLVVAGGGSCANNFGSGGAGGMLSGTFTATSTGNYPITVGIGGLYTGAGNGANGGNSTLTTPASVAIATSIGGGGGGNTYTAGNSGGSGGGAGSSNGGQAYGNISAGTAGQGNNGGASGFNSVGGGGGAGGAGTPLTTGQNIQGVGGAGLQNNIRTGSAVYYSAGGGPVSNAIGYDRAGFGMGGQLFGNAGTSHLSGTQGIVVLRYVIG